MAPRLVYLNNTLSVVWSTVSSMTSICNLIFCQKTNALQLYHNDLIMIQCLHNKIKIQPENDWLFPKKKERDIYFKVRDLVWEEIIASSEKSTINFFLDLLQMWNPGFRCECFYLKCLFFIGHIWEMARKCR